MSPSPCRRFAALALVFLTATAARAAAGDAVVAAESPLAADAGAAILAEGGSAVDAAIATSLAVCVVNPSSCGIGGGGFLVLWDAARQRATVLDYREVAPAATRESLYESDGVYDPAKSRRGPLAIGVPGEIAGLAAAHVRFGRLAWPRLVAPAARLAREGFPIGPHLAKQIAREADAIARDPELAAVLLDETGRPRAAGTTLRAPALAATLDAVAAGGPAAFYGGRVARAIADEVQARGGVMTMRDLERYRPIWREPLAVAYRDATVYTMPPPSGGGPALVLALRTLSRYDVAALGPDTPTRWQLFAEILQHAFAERARSAGDPAFGAAAKPPSSAIPAARLSASRTHPPEYYGKAGAGPADSGTSHVSVISADASAVACTTTINTSFGALVGVPGTGILLNNEIDDFSFDAPNVYGIPPGAANRVAPGKRPASSMTPTVAVRDGRAVAAVGASGGPLIVSATLEVLSNVLDFGMSPEAAVAAPRVHHQWRPHVLLVEPGVRPIDRAALARLGHELREIPGVAAVSLATAADGGIAAGAGDARKGGGATVVHVHESPPPGRSD
jgi:gamma-glutamyltranspeptidase/glutathione hydrolase